MVITKCSRVKLLLPGRRCIVLAVFHVLLSLALLRSEKLLIAFTCTACKTPSISLTHWEIPLCCVRRNTLFSINQEPKRQTNRTSSAFETKSNVPKHRPLALFQPAGDWGQLIQTVQESCAKRKVFFCGGLWNTDKSASVSEE